MLTCVFQVIGDVNTAIWGRFESEKVKHTIFAVSAADDFGSKRSEFFAGLEGRKSGSWDVEELALAFEKLREPEFVNPETLISYMGGIRIDSRQERMARNSLGKLGRPRKE